MIKVGHELYMAPCALVVFQFDSVGDMDNKDRSLAVVLQCRFLLGLQSPTVCLMNKTYCNFTQVTGASTFAEVGFLYLILQRSVHK